MQQSIPSYQQRDAHWMHQALLDGICYRGKRTFGIKKQKFRDAGTEEGSKNETSEYV